MGMKITVNDKKLSVNEWTRDRIENKLTKLDRYFKSDAEAYVKLSEERGIYKAEVTVNAGSMVYRAQEKSGDVTASFDAAVDAIDRQIRKNKTHLEKRLHFRQDYPPYDCRGCACSFPGSCPCL